MFAQQQLGTLMSLRLSFDLMQLRAVVVSMESIMVYKKGPALRSGLEGGIVNILLTNGCTGQRKIDVRGAETIHM